MSGDLLKESLRRELERLDALDVDLAVVALGEIDTDADVALLASELKQRKPFLFKPATRAPLAMGEIPDALAVGKRKLEDLAAKAREGSDRSAMARFMRARRGG